MSGAALFRIERKETLEQRLAEKKKLTVEQRIRASSLVIGTRSSADFVLNDPIAAGHHCEIRFTGGRFVLRDVDNSTGTYVNGARIEGEHPLEVGDRIVLGVSTIEWVAPDDDGAAAPNEITLHVREGAFFYAAKKRGEFQSDADEWVRSEVTFGRMPTLRKLNVLGIAAALGAGVWLWTTAGGRNALQPGHLSGVHAALFSDNPPTDPHLASAVAIAQEQGCAACHGSFDRPDAAKCAACHTDVVDAAEAKLAHPFESGDALECSRCHREHHGEAPPPGALHPVDITQDCKDCHGGDYQSPEDLREGLALAATKFALAPTSAGPLARTASVGFEAFDHGAHHRIGDCSVCHEASPGARDRDPNALGTEPDFTTLGFAQCMDCHAADAQPTDRIQADWIPGDELRWNLAWHGSGADGEHCTKCHGAAFEAPLRQVEHTSDVMAVFTIASRSHAHLFDGSNSPGECATCHKAGRPGGSGRTMESRPFRHEQHLSFLQPEGDDQIATFNAQCGECHADMASSEGLVAAPEAYLGPPVEQCAKCHQQDDTSLLTEAGVAAVQSRVTKVNDFPHDAHAAVEGGCFACHSISPEDPGTIVTSPEASSCVQCHARIEDGRMLAHASFGSKGAAGCDTCHPPRPEQADGSALAAVFYPTDAASNAPSRFPHFLEAHQRANCSDCHGEMTEGQDVVSPPESATACRECHAATRFHWR